MTEKAGGRVKKTYLQVKQMPDSTSEPEAMEACNVHKTGDGHTNIKLGDTPSGSSGFSKT